MEQTIVRPSRVVAYPSVVTRRRDDGTILIENALPLPNVSGTIVSRLAHWAKLSPDSIWLSEGGRQVSFAAAAIERRALSARLLAMALSVESPLLILADNGIDHALAMMAATAVGIPVAIVSPAYAGAAAAPWNKLARVLDQVRPGLILAGDVNGVRNALIACNRSTRVAPLQAADWLPTTAPVSDQELSAAEAAIGPDTIAKLLFTSGSTGVPKAVANTQRMMVSNMLALSLIWPFLAERPPVMVDWLPWNHTFGGNCCFNIALWFGGHLHIDKGRPIPALIGSTIEAIKTIKPTIYFNVPIGYELMLPALETDRGFARDFFERLDFLFNAGAALPAALRTRLEQAAVNATGHPPNIVGGWGSTETAPFSTALSFPTDAAANLGVPIPGTTIKMVPVGERFELRVKGPNVTPGYWRDPAATEAAFDEEGFYLIGDAGKFRDPEDPAKGIVFDGRVAENFKLSSGTFVNVGALRLALVSAAAPLLTEVVVAGEGRRELGALLFANEAACRTHLGDAICRTLGDGIPASAHPDIASELARRLRVHNDAAGGSSVRIARFLVASEPPSAQHDEITDKGYVNQRRVLARRALEVERLFESGHLV